MTDDVANAAAPEAVVSEPVDTSPTPPDPVDVKAEPTPRNSIDRAFDAAFTDSDDDTLTPKTAAKEAAPDGRERNADGTFKAKEDAPGEKSAEKPVTDPAKPVNFNDAPGRFSEDAKAAWKESPEPVRAEITRAIKELEGGIEQYKQEFEPYREFSKELKEQGQSFADVLGHYRGIETLLARDPLAGLDKICSNLGMSLRQVAAHVMGQPADQAASQQDATTRALRQEIDTLKRELSGVSTTIQSQREEAQLQQIQAFASSKERFEDLAPTIAKLLQGGVAADLDEAYQMAERLNPAPQATVQTPATVASAAAPQPDRQAQTLKGQKSVTGAPSSGSNPTNRKPPSSAGDAIDRAFATVGI